MRAAVALVSAIILAACNVVADAQENGGEGSGRSGQRSFDVGRFDAVSMGGAYDVVINVGPAHSVRAEGDEDELARMEVKVEDGDLHIGRKKGRRWSIGSRRPVTVYVTTPSLRAASIGGAGDMRIDRVEGRAFEASIGGAGDMRIDALEVDRASFSIAGAGGISAVGHARTADISIAGAGDMNLDRLESRTADISIVGSGNVRARAVETADISIMGSGDVTLGGGAKCNVTKVGSGGVRCHA
jgi:Putative auto-transporter adhesin, head GIN domain